MSKTLLACALIVILLLLVFFGYNKSSPREASFQQTTPNSIEEIVIEALKGTKGKYAVVIKNLKTNDSYYLNEHQEFEAGSLYKLWVMAVVYEKIKNGNLKEDEKLSADIATLNKKFNIDPDEAELKEGGVTMTTSDALNQMITISHNYAALLLTDRVGNSSLSKFLKEYGFNNSKTGQPPKTTASDTANFFEKLYKGEIIDKDYSQKMIELLKKQQLNDGLPKNLPAGVEVAHKTGEINWSKHDGGIVFSEKGDYIIVVLSESESPLGAQERIASLSRAIWDYMSKAN